MFGVCVMKRYVIVNKKRFTIFMTLVMIFSILMIQSVFALVNKVEGYSFPTYKQVIVEDGDTIWKIAEIHKQDDTDIRKVIHDIGSLNELNDYSIKPGQVILIPIDVP